MERGYIKLYRKILDTGLIQNPHALQVFCYLLLEAAYKPVSVDARGEMIQLVPGQLTIGRKKIAEDLKIGEQVVRTALKYLKKNEILTINPTKRYTLISIINWDTYQAKNEELTNKLTMSQPCDNHELTMSQPCDNHELTMSQPCDNHELTTIKEFKNIKNLRREEFKKERREEGKNIKNQKGASPLPPLSEDKATSIEEAKIFSTGNTIPKMKKVIETYTKNQELRDALLGWLEMRNNTRGKKPTGHALDLALKRLGELATTDLEKVAIVNESTLRNWTTFYALKNGGQSENPYSRTSFTPPDKTAYVLEQNKQAAQRWLEREQKKQEAQNGYDDNRQNAESFRDHAFGDEL